MPRPKVYKNDRVQLQIRLTPVIRKRLEREAGRRMVSKNFLAEKAIEDALVRWEKEDVGDTAPLAV